MQNDVIERGNTSRSLSAVCTTAQTRQQCQSQHEVNLYLGLMMAGVGLIMNVGSPVDSICVLAQNQLPLGILTLD